MDGEISVDELLEIEASSMEEDEAGAVDPETEVWFLSDCSCDSEEEIDTSSNIGTDFSNINSRNMNACSGMANKRIELANVQRKNIVDKLLLLGNPRILPKGSMKRIAAELGVHRTTIHRIWMSAKKQMTVGATIDVRSRKRGRVGRKPKAFDMERLKAIPIQKRTTIRALSNALEIGCSAVYRLMKSGQLRAHTNSINPTVKHHNKVARLHHILRQVIPKSVSILPKFDAMYNLIHMDEKWFYMSHATQRFYLFPWENDPYRATQNKKFIAKVMFMAAVGKPHIGTNGEIIWDGKVGIFPFIEIVPAKRSSKNRIKGTNEMKAIQSITQEVIRKKLIEYVLPAIRAKWPSHACKDIWIQQDNARPHISVQDEQFTQATKVDGFNIHLICQPAQRPDLNILDLGFFRAIQSIQYKSFPNDIEELVKSVEEAFDAYEPRMMNYKWIHLQYAMLEILKVKGGNNYKNPHVGKQRLESLGLLPKQVEVPEELLQEVTEYLNEGQIHLNVTGSSLH